jgi:cell division protein FtsI (penicillin-binding protein 3)
MSVWHDVVRDSRLTSQAVGRLLFVSGGFCFCFALIGVRLVDLMILSQIPRRIWNVQNKLFDGGVPRADIIDRNGIVLATHLITASVYADTRDIQNLDEAIALLSTVLTEIPIDEIRRKLSSGKSFVWLARHLTPRRQYALQHLGLTGVYLKKDYKRVYPFGRLACHVIGHCDVDGVGLTGVENHFNMSLLASPTPLKLSIDVRVQHVVSELLIEAIQEFKAVGGNVIVMDAHSGEIIAMESYPNFDLNKFGAAKVDDFFNRNTLGVYEMGSVFKVLNTAIALESGKVSKDSVFDARHPVKVGRFQVTDFRGKNQFLRLDEAFVYSSNIAAVQIALQFGGSAVQKKFFSDFGVFEPVALEIPETGRPIYPSRWTNVTTMSSAYGYGLAISPIRMLSIINGITSGYMVAPTLLCGKPPEYRRIVSTSISTYIRHLMRRVVCEGTARKSNVAGYRVFAKTGTAYKNKNGQYDQDRSRITIWVGGFPEDAPKYVVLFMLDEPKPTSQTFGFATAGWNVTAYSGKLIARIAPMLGVPMENVDELPTSTITPVRNTHQFTSVGQFFGDQGSHVKG